MKRSQVFFLLGALLLGFLLAYVYINLQDKNIESEKELSKITAKINVPEKKNNLQFKKASAVKGKREKPKSRKVVQSKKKIDSTAPVKARVNTLAKEGLVQIEIKDNMAIAFGDIILGHVETFGEEPPKVAYNEIAAQRLWDGGRVPYMIEAGLPNREEVQKAVDYFNQNTVVRMTPFRGEPDFVIFKKGDEHCYSYLGRQGGGQPIVLSDKCKMGEIMHEIMHVLGFFHEQSRFDRDEYLQINWENIDPKYENQFHKVPEILMTPILATEFDYTSIMLYPENAFSVDGESITMESVTDKTISPVKNVLSEKDRERLYLLYDN